jgi:hypothetical protein
LQKSQVSKGVEGIQASFSENLEAELEARIFFREMRKNS